MIEVMIAMLLAVIAVVGLVGLFSINARSARGSRHTTEAAVLAEDKMEVLRTEAVPVSGTDTGLDPLGAPGGTYDRAWTIVSSATQIEYQVVVSWDEDGTVRNVTMRSKRGL